MCLPTINPITHNNEEIDIQTRYRPWLFSYQFTAPHFTYCLNTNLKLQAIRCPGIRCPCRYISYSTIPRYIYGPAYYADIFSNTTAISGGIATIRPSPALKSILLPVTILNSNQRDILFLLLLTTEKYYLLLA